MVKCKHIIVSKKEFKAVLLITNWTPIYQKEVRVRHRFNFIILLHKPDPMYEFIIIHWKHIYFLKSIFVPTSKYDQLLRTSLSILSDNRSKINSSFLQLNI